MTRYEYGVRRASDVVRMSPEYVEYWLDRAKKGRGRLTTRLFLPGKRAFLDGFIMGLQAYQERLEARNPPAQTEAGRGAGADAVDVQAVVE